MIDWLGEVAQRQPDLMAVMDAASRRRHTFGSFDSRANQIAHFCEQWVGLWPGDCIGLLSPPSDDVLQIVVAAGKLGATALLLDPAAAPDALIAAINTHGPRTVFYGLAQAELVRQVWFEVDSVEHFIPLRGAVDTADFEDIVAYYSPALPEVERVAGVPWLRFAAEGMTWPGLEEALAAAAGSVSGDGPWQVASPLHRPAALAAAIAGLQAGRCVVVEAEAVRVVESPGEMPPTGEDADATLRNVPTGRSWLPHEFL
jgi:acyl-CoA synthetase (AMP-forming)/AMP-acid ligase II